MKCLCGILNFKMSIISLIVNFGEVEPSTSAWDFPGVQWLGFHALNTGDSGLIPGQGTRSHMLQWKTPHAITETQGWALLCHFSRVWLFVSPCTLVHQASLSMGFSGQEYWSELPRPPPGDLLESETEPGSLMSPALAGGFSTTRTTWKTQCSQVTKYRDKTKQNTRRLSLACDLQFETSGVEGKETCSPEALSPRGLPAYGPRTLQAWRSLPSWFMGSCESRLERWHTASWHKELCSAVPFSSPSYSTGL